jgi:hypothetical protein
MGASPVVKVELAVATSGPGATVIEIGAAAALAPLASLIVSVTEKVPGPANVCEGFWVAALLPSPKFHA